VFVFVAHNNNELGNNNNNNNELGPDNILAEEEEERRPPGRFATSRYSPTLMPTHTPASNKQRSDTKAPL